MYEEDEIAGYGGREYVCIAFKDVKKIMDHDINMGCLRKCFFMGGFFYFEKRS